MIRPELLEPLKARQTQIAKRRADLASRLAKLQREDDALAQEGADLETTLKTLGRIYSLDLSDGNESDAKSMISPSTKPEGTPTLYEMVTNILDDWSFIEDSVEGDKIFAEIRRRYWPDAPRNSIIPSLWRFAKEGRLVKDGTRYGLVQQNEASGAATPNASQPGEDDSDDIPF